jgi:hypothetical protein
MTVSAFIENKQIDGFQIISTKIVNDIEIKGKIINVILEDRVYGFKINTSNIESGTELETITDYIISGDILSINDLTLDLLNTNILNK